MCKCNLGKENILERKLMTKIGSNAHCFIAEKTKSIILLFIKNEFSHFAFACN